VWLRLRQSSYKRPQVQYCGVYTRARITLRPHTGKVPQLQRKPYCVQQQVREEVRSRHSGVAQQKDWNSRTGSHEQSYSHGNGDKQSDAWLLTQGRSSSRWGKRRTGDGRGGERGGSRGGERHRDDRDQDCDSGRD